jgi:hypothetical protein
MDAADERTETPETTGPWPLWATLVGLALVGHAALVLSGPVAGARWIAILECVVVCAVGLVLLRRTQDGPDGPAQAFGSSRPVASVFPARVAAHGGALDRVARTS